MQKTLEEFFVRKKFDESFGMRAKYSEYVAAKVSEQRIYFVGCAGSPRIQLTALKTLLIKPERNQLKQALVE